MQELNQYIATMNKLVGVLDGLPHKIATTSVNFFKERFVLQNWVDRTREPWKPRKSNARDKRRGRAILVNRAVLKRDVQKIQVTNSYILIGTTRLTVPYAKAHNEGFKGIVKVRQYKRKRYTFTREKYRTRSGRDSTRKVRVVNKEKGPVIVKSHMRKMNLPKRQFMGASAILDRRIERLINTEFVNDLK